jgi:DUF1680 family protein
MQFPRWAAQGAIVVCVFGAARALSAGEVPDRVTPVAKLPVQAFPLTDVQLLDGPFRHAMELDRQYLRSLDPDRLLHVFRLNAGLPSTAQPYGGWMAPKHKSRGEFVGHYLSGCARTVALTGDEQLHQQADRVVVGLAACQAKFGNGYLHTHPDKFTDRCEAPVPFWYQIHKVLAGLLDMHQFCGNQQALDVACKLGDWACRTSARFDDLRFQEMLRLEHGGMNEALANLYARTGERRYLTLSRRFNHAAVIGPAALGLDLLDGLHANTQIPKFVGAARQYELTGDPALCGAAKFFWDTVVRERSYVIGGHSDHELFSPKRSLSQCLSPTTCETCNTYNMLKLTHRLMLGGAQAEYGDYCERAIYNHIFTSQDPQTGMMLYYVPLDGPAGVWGTPADSFWCCYGTGIENHVRYGDSIYFHDDQGLYVNLFLASALEWHAAGIRLRQETQFPQSDTVRLGFTCQRPVQRTLRLRHPAWATAGIQVAINGQRVSVASRPGTYACLTRTWQTGDTVTLRLPMSVHTEAFRDNPRKVAVLFGPLALAAAIDPQQPVPTIAVDAARIPREIQPTGKPLCFRGSPALFRLPGKTEGVAVELAPFYQRVDRPHVVYWELSSPSATVSRP